jgi:uncharacterized repeat protein (TIGR03803 family)
MNPRGALVVGPDGSVYGTTFSGGPNSAGTVFRVSPDGTFTTLASFGDARGANPECQLFLDQDGTLYGTASEQGTGGFGTIFKLPHGGDPSILGSFDDSNGATPEDGLFLASDGNFYGTTAFGGASGAGTVFRITPRGDLTSLASFNSANGAFPAGTLTQGTDGNLYGTTSSGGAIYPYGTIFKITMDGVLTSLREFQPPDGYSPSGKLISAPDGSLYGATRFGGTATNTPVGGAFGTVFRFTPAGAYSQLAVFKNADGAQPLAPLAFGPGGNLYGATTFGGVEGAGTIFRVVLAPGLTAIAQGQDGMIRLSGSGPSGASYQLRSSEDLSLPIGSWHVLTNGVFDVSGTFTYSEPAVAAPSARFYRLATP